MKKTLLATAIAGALGASAAAQAATVYNQDGTQLDIYGNIQMAYYSTKDGDGHSEDELTDNGSTVGFSGQHIINPGLTGYFKAEFEHNADEEKINGGINSGDQAYLGLKGNFGDFRVGSWDTLIDDWVQDPIANNESFDTSDSTTALMGGNDINDVFFDEVRVPVANRVGEENKGWTYAKFLLLFERSNSLTGGLKQQLHRLKTVAAAELSGGVALRDDPAFAARVADYEVQLRTYDALELRTLGKTEPGAEASYLKILGTDLQQLASELTLQAVSYYGNPSIRDALVYGYNEPSIGPEYAAPAAPQYFNYRKTAIYAGSNEIQRNILSKAVLGM